MPLYEYSCGACSAVSEINHRMSDPAPIDCPVCGAPELAKQISAAGFRLKGAGWYETDFKSDGKRNLAGDGGGGADSKPAGEGKTETTPATKPEAKADAKPESKGESKAPAKTESKPAPKPASSAGGSSAATPG